MLPDKYRDLPRALYTADQVRELDRLAIEEHGIPGFELMRRAGRFSFSRLRELWPAEQQVTVYCGAGNNGGDGYIVAHQAKMAGLAVSVIMTAGAERLQGSALQAYQQARAAGVQMAALADADAPRAGMIVDAVLGTGLGGPVRGAAAEAITAINSSGLPVLAIDIPSGLCSDTGRVLGDAVIARVTTTFIGLKRGMFTGDAPAHTGEVFFHDLGVPGNVLSALQPSATLLHGGDVGRALGQRHAAAHKGRFGHVLVIGGDTGMAGAVAMAAEAAARVGAGLVSVATRPEHVGAIVSRRPELMVRGVNHRNDLAPLLERATVIAVGPGLGQSPWSEQMLQRALQTGLPLVLDADGLNLLVARFGQYAGRGNWVLTPHPGEAARLLETDTAGLQDDRFASAAELACRYSAAVVLKGAGSLVATTEGQLSLCPYGNPGMASGGMGDVLTGVIGGLVAQGLSGADAAALGVLIHARAADLAATEGQRGLLAGDVLGALRGVVN